MSKSRKRRGLLGAGLGHALAGPAGGLAGLTIAGALGDGRSHRRRQLPSAAHVEEVHEDDEVGRRWTFHVLSAAPSGATLLVRLLNDEAERLAGRPPFADTDGRFVCRGELHLARCAIFAPLGAVEYASSKHCSLEVTVCGREGTEGPPGGRAILDAALPTPRPWDVAEYLEPLVSLLAHLRSPSDSEAGLASFRPTMIRLAVGLGLPRAARPRGTITAMTRRAGDPSSLHDSVAGAAFRFPALRGRPLVHLLCHALGDHALSSAGVAFVERMITLQDD